MCQRRGPGRNTFLYVCGRMIEEYGRLYRHPLVFVHAIVHDYAMAICLVHVVHIVPISKLGNL
jgi:hypothetical protein